ncbi:hypothetical protein F4777DRAFT_569811 [Nemania sp. FL0916]|nr:hypothetical protein F4777DRAFT_569811 [Nemania sp. FL0916]
MSFTLMPFLYYTRTIVRIPQHRAAAAVVRSLHATARRADDRIPFDYEVGPPDGKSKGGEAAGAATGAAAGAAAPFGTITPTERQIFERIFADIEARTLQPATPSNGPRDRGRGRESGTPSRAARLIMQQAAQDVGQSLPATVSAPGLLAGAAEDRAKALLRFPPQLRDAAGRALDAIRRQAGGAISSSDHTTPTEDGAVTKEAKEDDDSAQDEWKAPPQSFARKIELEAQRQPERTRIEGAITSATSDFELWDVLERDVFSIPARLDIEESKKGRRGRNTNSITTPPAPAVDDAKPDPEVDVSESDASLPSLDSSGNLPDPDKPQKLSLYIHGPLFPAYLLLALRQLNTAFSTPSPLVFSILPRIKELGLEAYVLGVSTPFFNELLAIHWERRGDVTGILNLLDEMRHSGIYFDKRSLAILNQVDVAISNLADDRSRGGLGKALMLMPEYEHMQRLRIREWHKVMESSARERWADIGFAESAAA